MIRRVLACCMTLLLVAGCQSKGEADAQAAVSKPKAQPVAIRAGNHDDEFKLPDRLRLPSVEYVKAAPSWDDRLATLTSAERSKLESVNARYYGALEFHSLEEQRQLIKEGVPMPEEWLAAAAMTDQQLLQLADAQSPKASMFFADRQLDRYFEAMKRLEGTDNNGDFDSGVINAKAQSMVYASNALALTRSPFAAYLYGSIGTKLFGKLEYTAAAISVAWALGDDRARLYSQEFSKSQARAQAPLSIGSLAAIESTMWREIHRYRPL